ncbi:MAG: hypothetical protein ABI478_02560, partial [Propionivibrio sp.]
MPATLPAGPYRTLTTVDGDACPYYIIPFDKDGRCEGPRTRDHLLDAAAAYSDIFLFSHGWNNDWKAATERYESFIAGFQKLRHDHGLDMPVGYRPLLVGIFWPSQALAWFDSETGPGFAAGDPVAQDVAVQLEADTLRDVAAALSAERRDRFYELVRAERLEPGPAQELAAMLAALVAADDEGARGDAASAQDLLAAATALATPEPDYDAIGNAAATVAVPQTAGLGDVLAALDPRNIV